MRLSLVQKFGFLFSLGLLGFFQVSLQAGIGTQLQNVKMTPEKKPALYVVGESVTITGQLCYLKNHTFIPLTTSEPVTAHIGEGNSQEGHTDANGKVTFTIKLVEPGQLIRPLMRFGGDKKLGLGPCTGDAPVTISISSKPSKH